MPLRRLLLSIIVPASALLLPLIVVAPKCTNETAACPHLVTVLADECVSA